MNDNILEYYDFIFFPHITNNVIPIIKEKIPTVKYNKFRLPYNKIICHKNNPIKKLPAIKFPLFFIYKIPPEFKFVHVMLLLLRNIGILCIIFTCLCWKNNNIAYFLAKKMYKEINAETHPSKNPILIIVPNLKFLPPLNLRATTSNIIIMKRTGIM